MLHHRFQGKEKKVYQNDNWQCQNGNEDWTAKGPMGFPTLTVFYRSALQANMAFHFMLLLTTVMDNQNANVEQRR